MKKAPQKGATSEQRRKARLAEALRNNLSLRKARGRAAKSDENLNSQDTILPEAMTIASPLKPETGQ